MSGEMEVSLLLEIRNWVRAAAYQNVRMLLVSALPDTQARKAYQMFDGKTSVEQIRAACKMSPNKLITSAQKWTSIGIMEVVADKKRRRIFDLYDFDLLDSEKEEG
jgi:hypothetical protein